ncbi:MAG TPA: YceI family protein, partial [Thermomicrobiales bacterium]|nr:YceI family protein [Thermomicrobiales bacterium]
METGVSTAIVTNPAATTATTWAIDPAHTTVEFSVKHMMVSSTKGRFGGVSGTLVIDEQNPERSSAEVKIDASTVDTREERRDAHLRSADFFNVEVHPEITFKSTRVVPESGDRYKVYGDLTILGVSQPVVLDTEYHGQNKTPWGSEVVGFTATTKISRKEWGLTYNAALETGGFLVGDEIKIQLE